MYSVTSHPLNRTKSPPSWDVEAQVLVGKEPGAGSKQEPGAEGWVSQACSFVAAFPGTTSPNTKHM